MARGETRSRVFGALSGMIRGVVSATTRAEESVEISGAYRSLPSHIFPADDLKNLKYEFKQLLNQFDAYFEEHQVTHTPEFLEIKALLAIQNNNIIDDSSRSKEIYREVNDFMTKLHAISSKAMNRESRRLASEENANAKTNVFGKMWARLGHWWNFRNTPNHSH